MKFPAVWFTLSAAAVIFCGILHLHSGRKEYAHEFLSSVALLLAGLDIISGLNWLRLAYFPLMALAAWFYGIRTVILFSIFLPIAGVSSIIARRQDIVYEAVFYLSLSVTSLSISFFLNMLRGSRDRTAAELEKIRTGARDRKQDTEMESLGSDEIISHYFASKIKTDEEIRDLLDTVRHAVFADAAHFFETSGDSLSLRCSTEDPGSIMVTGKGIIQASMRERRFFHSGEVDEKQADIGYIKNIRVLSLMAVPVMEGSTPVGLLAVDASRYHSFSEPEQKTAQMFSAGIARVLERERVYTIIKHDITGLRIIKEFSSSLASSINYDVVLQKLCVYAKQAFSGEAFFFEHDGGSFIARQFPSAVSDDRRQADISGTLLGLAVDNRHKEYVSDTRQFRLKILPQQFRTDNYRSVIAVPLYFEGDLLGIFGMFSMQREFLDSRQISLVEVMCNQASTSIANAKMHSEIEKMATTDGLTGLFNHRVFQQKLSEELKRSERHSSPVSLLLTDIDFFKKVNDTYGHPVGDLVLRGVAGILREYIREIDIAARYGGEEFAVILPGTDSAGAKHIAERLRNAVMAKVFSADGKTLKVTTSIGIATVPLDAKAKEELIEKTDQALYYAKHNGRNRSVQWTSIR